MDGISGDRKRGPSPFCTPERPSTTRRVEEAMRSLSVSPCPASAEAFRTPLRVRSSSDLFSSSSSSGRSTPLSAITDQSPKFGKAVSPRPIRSRKVISPKSSRRQFYPMGTRFIRFIAGTVSAEHIRGLAPPGSKDCFATLSTTLNEKLVEMGEMELVLPDLEHATTMNKLEPIIKLLNLHPKDEAALKTDGAWVFAIVPGIGGNATPVDRLSEQYTHFVEGGKTKSGLDELVVTNELNFPLEVRAGNIKIYRIDPKGETLEWKFLPKKDVLLPKPVWDVSF